MFRNKALFLDRDGVINVDKGYVYRQEEFEFKAGIFELCSAAQHLGYLLIVITNQAGIARGFYTEPDFLDLTDWMIQKFAQRQIRITGVYYCPYHPIHGVGRYMKDSPDRKPNPGMIVRAQRDFALDLESSVLIGDKLSDVHAGRAAGVGTSILLRSRDATDLTREPQWFLVDSLEDIRSGFFSISQFGAVRS